MSSLSELSSDGGIEFEPTTNRSAKPEQAKASTY